MNDRLDTYYLHRGRKFWILWTAYWDDEKWEWVPVACIDRKNASERQAAVHLLAAFWNYDVRKSDLDHFHWINEAGYLSVAELMSIAREVWGGPGT